MVFLALLNRRGGGGGGGGGVLSSILAICCTVIVAPLYNQLRITIGGGDRSGNRVYYNALELLDQMDQPRNLSSSSSSRSFRLPNPSSTKFTSTQNQQHSQQQQQLQSLQKEESFSSETIEYLFAHFKKNVTTTKMRSVTNNNNNGLLHDGDADDQEEEVQEQEDYKDQNSLQSISSPQPISQQSQLSQSQPQLHPKPVYRKWAYAFLIGGVNSKDPEYRGFLYNTIVATKILQTHNTQADVVLLVQMSMLTNETKLPEEEETLLQYYNIKIKYLPKFLSRYSETFYALVMEKFRILQLVDYSRVLFLDGDIMPYCSLDYIFELSEPPPDDDDDDKKPPLLKENVILSWKDEPANAGFFMLKPSMQEYKQIQRIIIKKEKKALQIGQFPWWDPVEGWGHIIQPEDSWRSEYDVRGTNWTWHASFADQGLLYYWTKYIKHNVSQIIGNEIDHYTSGKDSRSKRQVPVLESTTYGTLRNFTCSPTIPSNKNVPHRDFIHFTGTYVFGVLRVFVNFSQKHSSWYFLCCRACIR